MSSTKYRMHIQLQYICLKLNKLIVYTKVYKNPFTTLWILYQNKEQSCFIKTGVQHIFVDQQNHILEVF